MERARNPIQIALNTGNATLKSNNFEEIAGQILQMRRLISEEQIANAGSEIVPQFRVVTPTSQDRHQLLNRIIDRSAPKDSTSKCIGDEELKPGIDIRGKMAEVRQDREKPSSLINVSCITTPPIP